MLIDTSSLPDLDDTAPWDDSGGDQKEKRPGVQDLSDEMESDNDTESNTNIIAADDGNINSNGGKYEDFARKMIAKAAERKRAAANDGWKQYESVPPVGIQDDIKKSDSGIAVREGKEFRQRDDLVIESREITQPEATERHETHEAEQSQSQQETVSEKADNDWRGGDYYSYTSEGCAHRAFDRAIKYKSDDKTYWQTKGIFLTIASAARRNNDGEWITKMTISSLTGDTHGNASRKIRGWIERLENVGLLIPLKTGKRDGRAWKMGFTVHQG